MLFDIIDVDDVLAEFRLTFAKWLNKNYDTYPDVESEDTAVKKESN